MTSAIKIYVSVHEYITRIEDTLNFELWRKKALNFGAVLRRIVNGSAGRNISRSHCTRQSAVVSHRLAAR
jgi:hypothetical protein